MDRAKHDPESLDDFSSEPGIYTIQGYRDKIKSLEKELETTRRLARIAFFLSTEESVKEILKDSVKLKKEREPGEEVAS